MKYNLIILYLIFSFSILNAQPIVLKVGNSWTYKDEERNYRYKHFITDSGFVFNNKTYFKVIRQDPDFFERQYLVRYDTNDSIYYYFNTIDSLDIPYYKKGLSFGDTIHFVLHTLPAFFYLVSETPGYVFNIPATIKWISIERFNQLTIEDELWAEEFGMLSNRDAITGNMWSSLVGCVIDGVVYGDTTVVTVEDYLPGIPTSYKLFQNYPNPFNPTTKIKYFIPRSTEYYSVLQNVILKVYDVLGNEVATLVNEPKEPGYYEVEFSIGSLGNSTEFASGVYIYRLTAGNFVANKKMIVIK